MNKFILCLFIFASANFNAIASTSSQHIPFIKYDVQQYEEIISLQKERQLDSNKNHIIISEGLYEIKYEKYSFSYKSVGELFQKFPNKVFLDKNYFVLDLGSFYQSTFSIRDGNLIKYIGYFVEDEVFYVRQNDKKIYNFEQLIILEYGSAEAFYESYIQEMQFSLKYNNANGLKNFNLTNAKIFLKEDILFYKDCYPQKTDEIAALVIKFVENQLHYELSDKTNKKLVKEFKENISKVGNFDVTSYYNIELNNLGHKDFESIVFLSLSSHLSSKEYNVIKSAFTALKKEHYIAYKYISENIVGNINKSTGAYYTDIEEFQEVMGIVFSED